VQQLPTINECLTWAKVEISASTLAASKSTEPNKAEIVSILTFLSAKKRYLISWLMKLWKDLPSNEDDREDMMKICWKTIKCDIILFN
jgi:hypothetical protein